MRKCKVIILLTIVCLIFATFSQAFANEKVNAENMDVNKRISIVEVNEVFETSELLKSIDTVGYKKALKIDGGNYNLYPTFDNIHKAIKNTKVQCNAALDTMQDMYELEDFDVSTVEVYHEYLANFTENLDTSYENGMISEEDYVIKKEQLDKFESFWDIFENDSANAEIVTEVSLIQKTLGSITAQYTNSQLLIHQLEELRLLLPYNTGGMEEVEAYKLKITGAQASVLSYSGNSKFSVEKGVKYAVDHATSPNTVEYGLLGQDCTNFVSQIKHEGGVPFYKTATDSDGWNLKQKTSGTSVLPKYTYATRWVNADKFVKFFGVKSKYAASSGRYKAFVNFAAAIKKGSFITYDKEADGNWNHNGFVTYLWHSGESSRRNIAYHGTTYKDFKVAQHTDNYHRWASHSKNGWDDLPVNNSKVVFAIVN